MLFFRRAFTLSFVAMILVAFLLFAFSDISSAHASAHVTESQPHFATALSHCPGTLRASQQNPSRKVCVVTVPGNSPSARPYVAYYYPCFVMYFQNGPFGSTSWANGWGDCVDQYGGNPYYVPRFLNDQASSWDSCYSGGTFYTNQPYTNPQANYPATSYGNFPWGAVANDALSSLHISNNSTSNLCYVLGTENTYFD